MNPDIIGLIQEGLAARGQAIPGAGGAVLANENNFVGRLQIASGDTASIAAGATGTLTISVQAPFRPDFIVLSTDKATKSKCFVTSIKVGTDEQLISKSSKISLDTFATGNLLGKVAFNTASPGVDITVTIVNTDASVTEVVGVAAYGIRLQRGG